MSQQSDPADEIGPGWRTQAGIGVALLVVALVVVLDAQSLRAQAAVGVGPSAAMRLVAAFVALLAVAHLVSAWRRRARLRPGEHAPAVIPGDHRAALAWVLGALLGLIAILQLGGGFILASAWLFIGTARGFGERVSPKSVAIGVGLSALVYLFFTQALSLGLPAGPLERLFG